jgi:uncharacterized protein (DUF111 family)
LYPFLFVVPVIQWADKGKTMKTIYFDCTNGVSGDMVLHALTELAGIEHDALAPLHVHTHEHTHSHDHSHSHDHDGHGRSYEDVRHIIDTQEAYTREARQTAQNIYAVIAKAEAGVHGATLETVHFHEVGRDQAIANALGIGAALDVISPDRVIASKINDGSGFVDCAHGRIPVPVPAVQAMMDECGRTYPALRFGTCADVDTEMVTPSGLAAIIGVGSVPAESGMMFMEGQITGETEVKGTRDTGRGGLRVYIIES